MLICVGDIRIALQQNDLADRERAELTAILDGIDRHLARDSRSAGDYPNDRDRAMSSAFARFAASLPRGTRIIVWTHNFHAAKSPAIRPDLGDAPIFGTLLHRIYENRVFTLAFSARGGSYRWTRKENRAITPPPPGALERAASGNRTAYLDSAALRAHGVAPAAADSHSYRTAPWADIYDGLIAFAQEQPPHGTRVYP